MTNVGRLEHIRDILSQYEKTVKVAEANYIRSMHIFCLIDYPEDGTQPSPPDPHSIEVQATTTLERIKGYLDD